MTKRVHENMSTRGEGHCLFSVQGHSDLYPEATVWTKAKFHVEPTLVGVKKVCGCVRTNMTARLGLDPDERL